MPTRFWARPRSAADGLLLNIVTGGGKTAVIAAVIAWLRIAHDSAEVRDALPEPDRAGPAGGRFSRAARSSKTVTCCRRGRITVQEILILTTLGSGKEGGWASLFSASVILGNIHQFYLSNKSGQSNCRR